MLHSFSLSLIDQGKAKKSGIPRHLASPKPVKTIVKSTIQEEEVINLTSKRESRKQKKLEKKQNLQERLLNIC